MNPDPIPARSIAGAKRPLEAASTAKRLRSKIPRRGRLPLLQIVAGVSNSELHPDLEEESSSSCLKSEVTFDSDLCLAGSEAVKRPKSKKPIIEQSSGDEFRRITRSYSKKKELLRSEVSEGANSASEIQISEVSQLTGGFLDGNSNFPTISDSSCLESISEAKSKRFSVPEVDRGSILQIAGDLSVGNGAAHDFELDSDLACSEQLSDGDDEFSEYSTCNEVTVSEIESDLFYVGSERDTSDYSVSDLFDSGGDFSERSSENYVPSAAFSLFLRLAKQLVRSSANEKAGAIQIDSSQEFTVLRFDEENDEESYSNIRRRERSEVVLLDFDEEYSSQTDCGDLILEQRLLMVNWMVEHSQEMKLHHETLFLGVSLMDRFLSRGYFQSERILQLLGVASVTLATRIEEVQPGNSIRQRSFTVGSNVYARFEVVAMEWLLLEVLNFQCMIPTTHNFLWFYLKAAKADAEVESLSTYLAVLSLLDHERLCFWPSTVAAGLVILACLATNRDASCLRVMETHVRNKSDDLPECIQSLEWLVKYVC